MCSQSDVYLPLVVSLVSALTFESPCNEALNWLFNGDCCWIWRRTKKKLKKSLEGKFAKKLCKINAPTRNANIEMWRPFKFIGPFENEALHGASQIISSSHCQKCLLWSCLTWWSCTSWWHFSFLKICGDCCFDRMNLDMKSMTKTPTNYNSFSIHCSNLLRWSSVKILLLNEQENFFWEIFCNYSI